MKKGSALFLRAVVIITGLIALSFYLALLPYAMAMEMKGDFDYLPLMIGFYLPAIPFFFALYQALKLLSLIDKNKAFSKGSVKALRGIKFSAFIISAIFAAGVPYVFYLADRDDAPGAALFVFVIVGASFVIGVTAALFQQLFQSAVKIKSENDLTV